MVRLPANDFQQVTTELCAVAVSLGVIIVSSEFFELEPPDECRIIVLGRQYAVGVFVLRCRGIDGGMRVVVDVVVRAVVINGRMMFWGLTHILYLFL